MARTAKDAMPTEAALKEIVNKFDDAVDEALVQQERTTRRSTLWRRLDVLKDGIKKLRDKDMPYKRIIEIIQEVTKEGGNELIVSEQTMRSYCQEVLGFKQKPHPRARAKKTISETK